MIRTPKTWARPPGGRTRILVVEGNLAGGYEHGLEAAFALGRGLEARLGSTVEVAIAGRAPDRVRRAWEGREALTVGGVGAGPRGPFALLLVPGLTGAALVVLGAPGGFGPGARPRAKGGLWLDTMVEG